MKTMTAVKLQIRQSEYRFEFQTQVLVNDHSSGTTEIGDNSYPISCFKFNYDLTCLAIGYTNGKVILVRGIYYEIEG